MADTRRKMGPRRLAQEAWRRFMTRNGARPSFNGLQVGQRIELAYKNGFDAGLTKGRQQGRQEANHLIDRIKADAAGQVLPAVLEGRSQRHQDFILLVQIAAEHCSRGDRLRAVELAIKHAPPDTVMPLSAYANGLVRWIESDDEEDQKRPAWLPEGV